MLDITNLNSTIVIYTTCEATTYKDSFYGTLDKAYIIKFNFVSKYYILAKIKIINHTF